MIAVLLAGCGGSGAPSESAAPVPPSVRLARLDLGAELSPPFDPDRTRYAVRASSLDDPVPFVAEPEDPSADVEVAWQTVDGAADGDEVRADADHRIVVTVRRDDLEQRYLVGLVPDELPEVEVEGDEGVEPPWVMVGSYDFEAQPPGIARSLLVVDRAGVPVWWRTGPMPSFDLRATRDGRLSWLGFGGTGIVGTVVGPGYLDPVTVTPAQLAGFELVDGDPHELDVLPDGGALLIAGARRHEDLSAWGGPADREVLHQVVEDLAPDGTVRFSWSTVGVQDYGALPAAVRAGMATSPAPFEPFHLNAASYDPDDGHLVVSLRLASTVLKVARTDDVIDGVPVAAGDVIWRLGGPSSDFVFVGDERDGGFSGFSEQHCARWVSTDRWAVFDNATSADQGRTGTARAAVYDLDPGAGTATLVASRPLPDGAPTPAGGSVQPLPDGGLLIGWGSLQEAGGTKAPAVTQVDADGQERWRLTLPANQWSYRAFTADGDAVDGVWSRP